MTVPRPAVIAIWLVRAFAVFTAFTLALSVWREGGLHWFIWLSHGGFALVSLLSAEALARHARWAWWALLILFGQRAFFYAAAVLGAYQQADYGTAMDHLRLVSALGAWLLFFVIVVGLLLHHDTRAAFRARTN